MNLGQLRQQMNFFISHVPFDGQTFMFHGLDTLPALRCTLWALFFCRDFLCRLFFVRGGHGSPLSSGPVESHMAPLLSRGELPVVLFYSGRATHGSFIP